MRRARKPDRRSRVQLELVYPRGSEPVRPRTLEVRELARPSLENRVALTRELAPRALEVLEREGAPRDHAKPETRDDALHVAHCCSNHGCAYDSDDCPVDALRLRQRSACGAAAPCERVRPVKLPPRKLDTQPPCPPRDRRGSHLTGGATRRGNK
jgi:hypothetical protein